MRRILLACFGSILAFAGGGGTVVVKAKPFMAEVASTPQEIAKGLRHRQSLAKDRCMVFVGTEDALQPLRTKQHLIALDDGRVVRGGLPLPKARKKK